MALKLGELEVDIGADTSDLKKANKEVKKTAGQMEKSFSRVGTAIAAALSFEVIKRVVLLADSMNQLDSRIKALTKSAAGFKQVREGIRSIAKETGTSIASVTELTQRALIAQDALGATNEQILEMVNNFVKLGAIGGTSQADLSRAAVQLGQALGAPRVQAEELNSILDATPLLAKEIEKNLGLLPGTLKQAVTAGKVLNTDLFQAMIKSTEDINKRFAELPLTVDRASGMIANSFATAVQEFDNGLGITTAIAEMMGDLSKVIDSDLVPAIDTVLLELQEIIFLWDSAHQAAQDSSEETFNWAKSLELVKDAISFIWTAIKELPVNLRALDTIIREEISQAFIGLSSVISKVWAFIATDFESAMKNSIGKVKSLFFEFIGQAQRGFSQMFGAVGADEIALSLANAAEKSKQTAADVTAFTAEQQQERQIFLELEIEQINRLTDEKIKASQMAIDASLNETATAKKDTKDRIAAMKAEMKQRRDVAAGRTKDNEKKVKDDVKTKDALQFNLKDAQSTLNGIRQAGIIDSKTAAIAQIGISGATAIAKTSELGFPAALPFIAQAFGAIVSAKDMLKGGGRQAGGNVSQGVLHPVNENGQPELLVQGSKQFLLSGQSGGQIIPGSAMQGGAGGGGMNVVVNNNAPDLVEVGEPFVTQGELNIAINRAVEQSVNQVDSSLGAGRGSTFDALRQGSNIGRNI